MYGLPMPKSGCPGANGFQWQTGYIYQDLEDEDSVTTVSPNSQLKGKVSGDVEQFFCIKDNITAAVERNRPRWPTGEYCIYQKGSDCPDGLQSGWMFWDDEDGAGGTNKNAHAGILSKGVFNHNTKIFFCCKNTVDGYKEPKDLPFASPFYLNWWRLDHTAKKFRTPYIRRNTLHMTPKTIIIRTWNRSHIHMEPTSPRREYITVTIEVTGSLIIKFLFVAISHVKETSDRIERSRRTNWVEKWSFKYTCDRLRIFANLVACMAVFSLSSTQNRRVESCKGVGRKPYVYACYPLKSSFSC